VNGNHPIVQKFILEWLEFWVKQMHVDGFRFDEGSILLMAQCVILLAAKDDSFRAAGHRNPKRKRGNDLRASLALRAYDRTCRSCPCEV